MLQCAQAVEELHGLPASTTWFLSADAEMDEVIKATGLPPGKVPAAVTIR